MRARSSTQLCLSLCLVVGMTACGEEPAAPADDGLLRVTEIGCGYYADMPRWFEVWNTSAVPAQLSRYTLRAPAILGVTDAGIMEFSLPALLVPAGGYAVVRGNVGGGYATAGQVASTRGAGGEVPFWTGNGFVELVRDGRTVDFVRFGAVPVEPVDGGWTGPAAPAMPYADGNDGKSLARDGANTDTDTAGDWILRDFATPGGPNDVAGAADADGDGIPDACEAAPGGTYAGLPLYAWGARAGTRDIFVHVDYMDSADPGVIPRRAALDLVVAAFASRGIAVHFDAGDLFSATADPAAMNLDGRSHRVPFAKGATLGAAPDMVDVYDYKYRYMPLAKRQAFHYLLMGYTQRADGVGGSSGLGEMPGNDFLVTLGDWGLSTVNSAESNLLVNWQASTIMHELGHNLGLRHGGDGDENYKPNYLSIMNYLYQLYGLPVVGSAAEGDRYGLKVFKTNARQGAKTLWELENGPATGAFRMDFSPGWAQALDETALDESAGLGRTNSHAVDFNNDGDAVDLLGPFNLNPADGTSAGGTLADYDDWGHLTLFFARTWSGARNGARDPRALVPVADPVGDDRQPLMTETLLNPRRD